MHFFVLLAVTLAQDVPARTSSDYVLGPNDQLTVSVTDLDSDFNDKTFRIEGSGDLNLPYAGRIHAAGLTIPALESQICQRLTRVLKTPQVVVEIAAYRTETVSVLGSVNSPGIHQYSGEKTLFDALSLAGGLRPDAGYLIRITRDPKFGPLPLPGAQIDSKKRISSASVKVKDILNATDSSANILLFPGDTISVPKADVVYAVGSVIKSGGFLLNEHETLSALQVLSLAEGLNRTAAANKARIIRTVDGNRTEIPVDLKELLAGKGQDVPLQAGDILFVPNSSSKSAGFRTLDTITGMAGAALIYAH